MSQSSGLYHQVANLAYEGDVLGAPVDAQYHADVCLVRLDRVEADPD